MKFNRNKYYLKSIKDYENSWYISSVRFFWILPVIMKLYIYFSDDNFNIGDLINKTTISFSHMRITWSLNKPELFSV